MKMIALAVLFLAATSGHAKAQCVCNVDEADHTEFETMLTDLIETQDNTEAFEFLKGGYPDTQNTCGYSLLLVAAEINDLRLIGELISAGANLNAANFEGVTPLFVATRNFHNEVVSMLLEAGANPNVELKECVVENFESTPLLMSAVVDNVEGMGVLLEHGADFTIASSKGYGFFDILLIKGNSMDMILDVLQSVPESKRKHAEGELLFEVARRDFMLTELEYLLSNQFSPNVSVDDDAPYNTPLLIAALAGNIDGAKVLIEHGADIYYTNPEGYSLERIIHENNLEELYYLFPSSE